MGCVGSKMDTSTHSQAKGVMNSEPPPSETTFYKLQLDKVEKEPTVYEQSPGTRKVYKTEESEKLIPELSERASQNAKFFFPYIRGEAKPSRPDGTDDKGFYFENDRVIAFRGRGGQDMAYMWHMLVVPRDESIRWIMDLKPKHLSLLKEMRDLVVRWVNMNRSYFLEKYKSMPAPGPEHWLKEENIQLGFHKSPTVGMLHMHALLGPLTEFGSTPEFYNRWISLENVLELLESNESLEPLLN